jgi:hypothetical protein
MRWRRPQPWYSDVRARLRFEGPARAEHPSLRTTVNVRGRNAQVVYRLTVDVPDYEARTVVIKLRNGFRPFDAQVLVDGPEDSPHRYGEKRLCLWDPKGPESERWVSTDGLCELIAQIRIHLFKEAYCRETGERWLGPEAPHAPGPQQPPEVEVA